MAANKRTKSQIIKDRADIAAMLLKGMTLRSITDVIGGRYRGGLAVSTIQRDSEAIWKEWREAATEDIKTLQRMELKKLEYVVREAWEAWDRSKEGVTESSIREYDSSQEDGKRYTVRTTKIIPQRDGNPQFLSIILQCIEKQIRILGLDASKNPDLINSRNDEPVGFAAMIALAQHPEKYAEIAKDLLPPEAYEEPLEVQGT